MIRDGGGSLKKKLRTITKGRTITSNSFKSVFRFDGIVYFTVDGFMIPKVYTPAMRKTCVDPGSTCF